jgi:hypothetical protein
MGESENENIQKYRSKSLSAVLDLCLEMARGREIDIDESYIYETFKKQQKNIFLMLLMKRFLEQ